MRITLEEIEVAGRSAPERLVRLASRYVQYSKRVPDRISCTTGVWEDALLAAGSQAYGPRFTVTADAERKATLLFLVFGRAVELTCDLAIDNDLTFDIE